MFHPTVAQRSINFEFQVGLIASVLAVAGGGLVAYRPDILVHVLAAAASGGVLALLMTRPHLLPYALPTLIVGSGLVLDGFERAGPRLAGELGILCIILLPVLSHSSRRALDSTTSLLIVFISVPVILEACLILLDKHQVDDLITASRYAARAAVCFGAGFAFSGESDRPRLMLGFLLAAVSLAVMTLLVAAGVLPLPNVENVGKLHSLGPFTVQRSIGLEISQSFGGVVFALGTVILLARLLNQELRNGKRHLTILALVLIIAAASVTFSRNVLLTVALAAVLFLALDALTGKRALVRPVLMLVMASLPLLIIPSGPFLTPSSVVAFNSHTVELRYEQYNWALSAIQDNLLVGIGTAQGSVASERAVGYLVHNEALRRLVETGLVGALSHYLALAFVLGRGIAASLGGRSPEAITLTVGVMAMVFASQFYPGTKPEFLWLICGLLLGACYAAQSSRQSA